MTTRWPGSPSRSARQAGPAVAPSVASHAASSRLLDVDARVHDSVRFLHGGFSCRHQPSKSVLRIGRFPAPLQDDTTGQLSTRSRRTPRPFSYMMPRPACTMALPWSAARRYRADSAAHQQLPRPSPATRPAPDCWTWTPGCTILYGFFTVVSLVATNLPSLFCASGVSLLRCKTIPPDSFPRDPRRTPRPFSYMMPRPACTMALPWSAARRYRADSAAHQLGA